MSISMALKHHDLVLKIGFVYEKAIFIHRRRNSIEVFPAQFQQYYQNNNYNLISLKKMTCDKNDGIFSFSACVHFLAFPTLKMAILLNTDKTVIYSRERLWRKWRKIIRGKIAREFWDPTGIIRDSTKRRRA